MNEQNIQYNFCDQFYYEKFVLDSIDLMKDFNFDILLKLFLFPFLQGGGFILTLVDFYGGGFMIFALAVLEVVAISYIYGIIFFYLIFHLFCLFDLPIFYLFLYCLRYEKSSRRC